MADRKHPGSVWHRTMTPPPYLASHDHDMPVWHEPIRSRGQQLDDYLKARQSGGLADPEMELRAVKRRARSASVTPGGSA